MKTNLYKDINNKSRKPGRRKPRSPGVSLGNRGTGLGYWDDEVRSDGGKAKLHRKVRHAARANLLRTLRSGE